MGGNPPAMDATAAEVAMAEVVVVTVAAAMAGVATAEAVTMVVAAVPVGRIPALPSKAKTKGRKATDSRNRLRIAPVSSAPIVIKIAPEAPLRNRFIADRTRRTVVMTMTATTATQTANS